MTASNAWRETARVIAALPDAEFVDRWSRLSGIAARDALRMRLYGDMARFCRYLWPERFTLPFNALHHELFALQPAPWHERKADVQDAVAAPRGFAKSTIVSFAEVMHDIVYDREAYIVILSATQRLSLSLSRDLRNQLKRTDGRLAALFGPFEVSGSAGEWEVSVEGRPSVGILSRSFGTEVRGAKHPTRGIRPTKVIIDDGEKKDRVRNPDQRQVWWESLTKDVLKLAPREGGTHFKVVGTILHPDSMLARLVNDAGWRTMRKKAIIRWPDRKDLWERCRAIWTDLTLGAHRRKAAFGFYKNHQAEMDAGAEILDPASKSLFELHEVLWRDGLASFLSELQNEPVDPTSQIFWSDKFARFRIENGYVVVLNRNGGVVRKVALADLRIRGHWDPSVGSAGGDFAAIAILGRDRDGYTYVLDLWMRRAKPSEQLEAAWTLAERHACRQISIESNGFQALVAEPYARQRDARHANGRFWQMILDPRTTTENKEFRIATLEPDCTNGWLLFNTSIGAEALQQFDHFPTGDHDDAPDAVQVAWVDLGGRPVSMETRPPGSTT